MNTTGIPADFVFTRDEDKNLQQALEYIAATYGEHYRSTDDSEIQLIDVWQSRGTLLTTAIDTAIKYLWRFGRKGGYNRKDIYKTIHYSLLALYAADQQEKAAAKVRRITDQSTVTAAT